MRFRDLVDAKYVTKPKLVSAETCEHILKQSRGITCLKHSLPGVYFNQLCLPFLSVTSRATSSAYCQYHEVDMLVGLRDS